MYELQGLSGISWDETVTRWNIKLKYTISLDYQFLSFIFCQQEKKIEGTQLATKSDKC